MAVDRDPNRRTRDASAQRRARGGWVLLTSLALTGAAASQGNPAPDAPALVHELSSREPRARSEAYVKLDALGAAAVDALLADFAGAPPLARELRARLVRDHARASDAKRVAPLASDPSPVVRAEVVKFAARPDLALANADARAELLLTLADDDEFGVRESALRGLERLAHPSAIAGLARLVRAGDSAQKEGALTALAATPRSAPALLELASFIDAAAPSLRGRFLLCLGLTGDGAVLAELLRWGSDPVSGPSARLAFAWLLQRQVSRRDEKAVTKSIDAWEAVEPLDAVWLRARHDLISLGDLTRARASAARLDEIAARETLPAFAAHAAAATVEAFCAVAEGNGAAAEAALERARGWVERDRGAARDERAAEELLLSLARLRTVSALNLLLNPFETPSSPAARLREAYGLYTAWVRGEIGRSLADICSGDPEILALYRQALMFGAIEPIRLQANWSFDAVLTSELGPSTLLALVLPRRERGREGLAAGRRMLDLLSDVNPREFVNTESGKDWQSTPDPFDSMRLLNVPGIPDSPVYVSVKLSLSRFPRELGQVARSIVGDFDMAAKLLDPVIARAASGSQIGDLEAYVQASLERAGVAMDARDGAGADAIVARVLDKLDAVKQSYEDDFDPEAVKQLGAASADALRARARTWLDAERRLRSGALITRAVNENVVRGRPDVAARYAKKGVELVPTEFNRVLLACYFAREGNAVEARALLRDASETEETLYNLACTYALLHEPETALHYLERDFERQKDAGTVERQRAWARRDPDLSSLAREPRFLALAGEGPASRPR
jgi:tetratricopeptide (TPR) repeat protein